jgi:ABC-type amino acid transport system permease subunit
MPNIFAFLVLFSFPLVAIALFRTLSLERALVWTLIAGHLLLPSETDIKFPMLPVIDRSSIASVSALILCAIMAPKLRLSLDLPARTGRLVIIGLLALVIVTPILTVLQNAQPVVDGRVFLPGLRLYDAYGLISQILFQMIPFWLGLRYLNTTTGHKALLEAIAIGGLAYTLPALFEIRMSPQLHTWVYGFFPHDFVQAIRDGGFRPVVFLNHGLMVGIFFCMSIISAVVLYREARREGEPAVKWLVAAVWLTLILYLSKNLGALVLAVIFASAAMFLGRRLQTALAVAVAVIVMLYPMLRGAGWIPVDTAYELALSISEERANSLKFRLDNEDALLEHANKKPLAGWGSWGRNSLWDPETGQMTSVTDGIWLIFIGVYGWLGYIGRFGLLTAPILFFALRKRRFGPSLVTPGVLLVLSANLIDLLPNAGLVNYVWLMAGSIAGKAVLRSASDTAETEGASSAEASDERASWLMPEELSTSRRRQKRSEQRGPLR